MNELADRADFTGEQLAGAACLQNIWSQHLESDNTVQIAMFSLEDTPHTATAELVENAILPQEKTLRAANEQPFGLEFGENAEIDQGTCNDTATIGFRQIGLDAGQLRLRH